MQLPSTSPALTSGCDKLGVLLRHIIERHPYQEEQGYDHFTPSTTQIGVRFVVRYPGCVSESNDQSITVPHESGVSLVLMVDAHLDGSIGNMVRAAFVLTSKGMLKHTYSNVLW